MVILLRKKKIDQKKQKSLFKNSYSFLNIKPKTKVLNKNSFKIPKENKLQKLNINNEQNKMEEDDLILENIPCEEGIDFKFIENYNKKNNKQYSNKNKAQNINFNSINHINITANNLNFTANLKSLDENIPNKIENSNINFNINKNTIENNLILKSDSKKKNNNIKINSINKNDEISNNNEKFNNNNINPNANLKKLVKKSYFSKEKNTVLDLNLKKEKAKILIVDDHTFIRSSLKINLEKILKDKNIKNFEIIEGKDGVDIINYIIKDQQQNISIKCVFSDENMEYINGSEAFEILKKLELKIKIKKIPLCSVTAYEDTEKLKGKNSKYKDVLDKLLIKPCSEHDLLQFLQEFKIL